MKKATKDVITCWCGNSFKTESGYLRHRAKHKEYNEEGDFNPQGSREVSRYSFTYNKNMALNRDNYTCRVCGKKSETLNLDRGYFHTVDVHHIIPRCKGGSDHIKNLITLCKKCHKNTFKRGYKGVPKNIIIPRIEKFCEVKGMKEIGVI